MERRNGRLADMELWRKEWPWCADVGPHDTHSFEPGAIGYEIHMQYHSHNRTCMHCGVLRWSDLQQAVYLALHPEENTHV